MRLVIAGFSLIELMIVASIIGILAMIAIPSYHHYTQRARYTEVIAATEPFKTAIAVALQTGTMLTDLSTGAHGVPPTPKSTKNLATLTVENGVITATATELIEGATYILKPNSDGSIWAISGSCLKYGLCHA